MAKRINVHGPDDPEPHLDCPDPKNCDCDCRPCKRVWFAAGRPCPDGSCAPIDPADVRALEEMRRRQHEH